MTAAWIYARRRWRARSGALVALAVMIALGVATSLTALAAARRSASVVDRFIAADRTGNVIVDLGNAPISTVARLRRLPGAAEVGLVANTEAFPEHAQGYVPMLASIDGRVGFDMQRGVLVEGRRADPHRAGDVMLSEQHARELGKHAGDPIVLRTFTKAEAERCLLAEQPAPDCDAVFKSPGGPKIDARVVGVLRTGVDLRNRDNELSLSFLTPAFHQAHPTLAADYLALVRLNAHASASDFVRAATRIVPASTGASFQTQNAAPVADAADVLALGFLAFGLVVGLAATIAVAQALTRQAATDGADNAVFRALGTSRQWRVAVGAFGLAPAIVSGVALGLLCAYLASASMPIGIARRAEPHPGRQFDVRVLGGGAFVIVAGLVALAITAAWLADRRITGLRPARTRYLKVPAGNRASRTVGLRYAFVTGRGTVPSHTAMVAIAAATAGVVAVVAFGASLSHLVDTPSLYGWTFDAVGIPTDRSDAVRADPGVASVAEVRAQLSLQIGGDPVNGYAIKPLEGDVDAPIVRGRAPQSLDEVALGADTMSHAGVGIGDRVSIGGQNDEQKMRVVGQAVFLTDEDAYPLADGALVSFDAAERLGSPDTFDTLGITFASGDHHATEQRLSKLAPDDFARPRPPAEVEKLEQVRRLPEFLAAFMVLLGVVAVAHAMVVSVRRNRRDLGVLRALGFRRRDVALTVTWQAIAIAVVGVVVGVPTGVFIGRALWHAIANGIGIRPVADVPLIALALVLPATVAVAVVAALLPAWKAARMHPTELLRSE